MDLVREMSEEEKVAVSEGLSEEEYGLFCILRKENMGKREREQVKQASKELLEKLESLTNPMYNWWEREQTRSAIEVEIRDHLYLQLPNPPFTSAKTSFLRSCFPSDKTPCFHAVSSTF